jgi:DNA/RNA-binding domain of Phe-tRNA-synthetase-like protein
VEAPGGPVGPSQADEDEVPLARGRVAPAVAEEFPELALHSTVLERGSGRSPREVRERLEGMSDRFFGSHAVMMRQAAIPWAYRVFFRQIGLDPDATRTPVEAAALDRLLHGRFESQNLLDDALTIALVETGVPIWALDADRVVEPLEIRAAGHGERLGREPEAPELPRGRLVVADAQSPVAILFGDIAPGHGVTRHTARMTLFALQVAGVPAIHVEEAFWICLDVLRCG